METIIEKMERNLLLVHEIYSKKNGNENCPVLKKAQPMITYILNKETEAYYSFRKSWMLREARERKLADNAIEVASQALEEADKVTKELTYMMKNECPEKNVSDSYIMQPLTTPKEISTSSVFQVFDTKKLI